MAGGSERERLRQARLRMLDVEWERALAGEGEVADRRRLDLRRLLRSARGSREIECAEVVVGEHVSHVFGPPTGACLDPGGGRSVTVGSAGPGDLRVADVAHEQVPEAVLAVALHRGGAVGADRLFP